jgi:hypothetical protein
MRIQMSTQEDRPTPTLFLIEGQPLVSVCFLLGYVEFLFGDMVLAALAQPILLNGEAKVTSETPGYKDALCRQIGRVVRSTTEAGTYLEVGLEGGARIVIPLDADYPPGPEMATLSGKGCFCGAWIRSNI